MAEERKPYTVGPHAIRCTGKLHQPGKSILLTDDEAASLPPGAVTPVAEEKKPAGKGGPPAK
jgi:hypothetical protein